jgi:hypothetical protein
LQVGEHIAAAPILLAGRFLQILHDVKMMVPVGKTARENLADQRMLLRLGVKGAHQFAQFRLADLDWFGAVLSFPPLNFNPR